MFSLICGGMYVVFGLFWLCNLWMMVYWQEWLEFSEWLVGWLLGFCLLVCWLVFGQVGGFDECYFMYMEDVDFGDWFGKVGWLLVYVLLVEVLYYKVYLMGCDLVSYLVVYYKSIYIFLVD